MPLRQVLQDTQWSFIVYDDAAPKRQQQSLNNNVWLKDKSAHIYANDKILQSAMPPSIFVATVKICKMLTHLHMTPLWDILL